MKVAELEGAMLDYWVAKAEGLRSDFDEYMGTRMVHVFAGPTAKRSSPYSPSGWWNYGGPIIERERIELTSGPSDWSATRGPWPQDGAPYWGFYSGPTPLIAAMRAYVASKFGDEVPDMADAQMRTEAK